MLIHTESIQPLQLNKHNSYNKTLQMHYLYIFTMLTRTALSTHKIKKIKKKTQKSIITNI